MIKDATISQLRNQYFADERIYVNDALGWFVLDSADTTSADDGTLVLVSVPSGSRYKRELGKDFLTLTELRAYEGDVQQLTMYYNGTFGRVQRDVTVVTDNTGTEILDGLGRGWKRQYQGPVEAAWFGFGLDATTNHTVLTTILDMMADEASLTGDYGSGELVLPKGNFELQGTVDPSGNTIGLIIRGQGKFATNLIFSPTSGILFQVDTFLFPSFRDMSILNGTISGNTMTYHTTSTAIAFKTSSVGGGLNFSARDLMVRNFGSVIDTSADTVNDDTFLWDNCTFQYNDYVWYNANVQALSWQFINCDFKFNKTAIFHNPGGGLQVRGGTSINDCYFIYVDAVDFALAQVVVDGTKFETYETIDAGANPYWLYLTGTAPATNIKFVNCSSKTGSNVLSGKYSIRVSGNYNVIFDNCALDGDVDAQPNASTNGSVGIITYINCKQTHNIVNTTSAGQGNAPTRIQYINSVPYGFTKRITTNFDRNTGNSSALSIPAVPRYENLYLTATVNNSTVNKSFPVFCPEKYTIAIKSAWIQFTDNGAVDGTVTLWEDSGKTNQICQYVKPASTSGSKYDDLVVNYTKLTNTSNSLYMEATSTGNAGVVTVRLIVEIMPL